MQALLESNIEPVVAIVDGVRHAMTGGYPSAIVALGRGRHVIQFVAPPFATKACAIDVPGGATGGDHSCAFALEFVTGNGGTRLGLSTVTISCDFVLGDLSLATQASVQGQIARLYADQQLRFTVPAGDYFVTGVDQNNHIISQRATISLVASVTFTPDTRQFIIVGPTLPQPAPELIMLINDITLTDVVTWSAADAAGHTYRAVFTAIPDSFTLGLSAEGDATVQLESVALDACQFTTLSSDLLSPVPNKTLAILNQSYLPSRGSAGCALRVYAIAGNAHYAAIFLSRFGVLLAANADASALAPDLPVAPPDEVRAVLG